MESIDSADWGSLASVDFHGLCVQGVDFDGADHYAVRELARAVEVVLWYDDPTDWPAGSRWARVTTIPELAPDAALGGAINTAHRTTIFADDVALFTAAYSGNPTVTVRPWADFVEPTEKHQHGRWVDDAAHAAHLAARALHGWREWTEGLDPLELDESGHVLPQRPRGRWIAPDGTRTYFASDTAGPAIHTADFNDSFTLAATGAASQTATGIGPGGKNGFTFVSPSNEPDSAAWPTTGVYRYQLDVTAVGADLTFGLLTQGAGLGHFSRAAADGLSDLQVFVQDQAAFSSSGLHLASVTNPAWTAGAVTDRWAATVASFRVVGHGNQTLTMQLGEADDFTDGPWAAAPVAGDNLNAPMLGAYV